MALSIVEILKEHGRIEQNLLAACFARRMQFNRGYAQGTYSVLCGVKDGFDWRSLAQVSPICQCFRSLTSVLAGGGPAALPFSL